MSTFSVAADRSAGLRQEIADDPARFRVLTGERPTGPLHLGHLFGTIQERVRLSDLGVDTFLVIADYQVITDRDAIGAVRDHVYGAVLDYLAAGIEPARAHIFAHSAVPELNQLMLPFF